MSSCHSKGSKCVRETIEKIIDAQDEVASRNNCCDTSCERSIRDLLSPAANGNGNGNTTIPFILYCKDCKPFIGSSVVRQPLGGSGNTFLDCLETPIFKAKKFVDGSKDCVKLELLIPVTMGGSQPGPSGKGNRVCDFFPGSSVRNLASTGVCITVDLDCICSIACLEPTTPVMMTVDDLKDAMESF